MSVHRGLSIHKEEPLTPTHSSNGSNVDHSQIESNQPTTSVKPSTQFSFIHFFFELLIVVLLAIVAFVVKFDTDLVPVTVRGFDCSDSSINKTYVTSTRRPLKWFSTEFSDAVFLLIVICVPLIAILFFELIVNLLFRRYWTKETLIRTTRFLGGFLIGFFSTSTMTTLIQLLVGRLRPYFINVCVSVCLNQSGSDQSEWIEPFRDDVRECGYQIGNSSNFSRQELNNLRYSFRDARMSLPAYEVTMAVFSAVFLVMYSSNDVIRQRHQWTRSLRFILSLLAVLFTVLVTATKLLLNRNHVEDLVVAWGLGTLSSVLVCLGVLNLFRESSPTQTNTAVTVKPISTQIEQNQPSSTMRTESSEFDHDMNSSTSDFYRHYWQIPRVILRNSIRRFRLGRDRQERAHELRTSGVDNPAFNYNRFPNSQTINDGRY